MKTCEKYKSIKTLEYPNGVVRIHIPDLTDKERARRMEQIHKAAAELLKSVK